MTKHRSLAGLLATAASVVALTVPATSNATTVTLPLPSLGAVVCPLLGNGAGSLNAILVGLNLRICPS
jgi:hypothetical protein